MIERQIRGDTVSKIAEDLQLSERTVRREIARGAERGYVEKVQQKLLDTLDAIPHVYAKILDPATSPEELAKSAQGYKIKLSAAKDLADGLGIFKRESTKTVDILHSITNEESEPKDAGSASTVRPKRVYFLPDVEGEMVEPEVEGEAQ
jgi:DeoR/GlpR family transcriptional regulator of sugar metabolism